jgi:hypothetical protein
MRIPVSKEGIASVSFNTMGIAAMLELDSSQARVLCSKTNSRPALVLGDVLDGIEKIVYGARLLLHLFSVSRRMQRNSLFASKVVNAFFLW